MTPTEMAGVVGRLAIGTDRKFTSDDDLMAVAGEWCEHLAEFEGRDVLLAAEGWLADPRARYFPPLSEFRKRVQLARMDRKREDGTGAGCAACSGSGGSIGWTHAGTDAEGREFVRPCPRGCKPPIGHRPIEADGQRTLISDPERAVAMVRELAERLRAGTLVAGPSPADLEARRNTGVAGLLALADTTRRAEAGQPPAHPYDSDF